MNTITVSNYTAKSIVVVGDTRPILTQMKELGGKWNANLRGGIKGWIFPLSKKEAVVSYLQQLTPHGFSINVDNSEPPQEMGGYEPGIPQNPYPTQVMLQPQIPIQSPASLMTQPIRMAPQGVMARPAAPSLGSERPNSFTVPFLGTDGKAYQLITLTAPLPQVGKNVRIGGVTYFIQTVAAGLPIRTAHVVGETGELDIILVGELYYVAGDHKPPFEGTVVEFLD